MSHVQLKTAFGMTDPPTQDEIDARVESAVTTFLARYATLSATAQLPADAWFQGPR